MVREVRLLPVRGGEHLASTRKRTERYQITAEAAIAGVLLSIAALSIEDAAVTGKKYDPVRMAIQRGRRE